MFILKFPKRFYLEIFSEIPLKISPKISSEIILLVPGFLQQVVPRPLKNSFRDSSKNLFPDSPSDFSWNSTRNSGILPEIHS